MGRWSAKLADEFLDFAGVENGERVLDVGSGTGNLALAIARRAARTTVIGIDPSAAYVAFARSRARPGLRFETGDAQALPFDDGSFDRALCQLVFNFIPDGRKAIREMRRVTRTDGVVAAALWDLARGGMRMLELFWEAVGPGANDARFGERTAAFTKEEINGLWNEAGLADIKVVDLSIDMEFASFDDFWTPFTLGQGPAGAYAASLPPTEQAALRERLRELVMGDRGDGPFSLPARAFAIRGAV